MAICPACGEHNPAVVRFCTACGARMTVDEGERRIVTVMFVELNGFLAYAETASAEDVRALADRATSRLIATVAAFDGTLDKIIGENGLKVMAIFGAPVAHGDDPERAVRAALAMHGEVARDPEAFAGCRLAIGIHTGEAIYAPVGSAGAYTVLGDTVNTAARLMGAAAAEETLVGAITARDVATVIELEEIPPLTVKNKVEPVNAWRARAIKGTRSERARVRAPLVGRADELEALRALWGRMVTTGDAHLATVVGAPGIGKSRLVGAFKGELTPIATLATGHCLSYGEGITYWPIVEIIRSLAGIVTGDPPEALSRKLGELLERLGIDDLDELRTIAVAIANLVAAPTTPRGTYSAEKIGKQELHWGIRRLLQLLAADRPVAITIEDLHWAEPTLLDLIAYLLEEPAAIFVLATARPEFVDGAPPILDPRQNRRTLMLEPLGADASRELLTAIVGPQDQGAVAALLDAAAGNPLYLEEIVQMLVDTGMLDGDRRPTGGLRAIRVPDSLQGLIDARLDRLAVRERRVAGRAAVIGQIFWAGALRRLDPDEDIERALAALADKDIVTRLPESSIAGEVEYAFKHALLRDVAYERIPKVERAVLHERCGGWIADLPGQQNEYIEFVAYHLEQAVHLARSVGGSAHEPPTLAAVKALQSAGLKSERREGGAEADRYYARALALVGERYPETSVEIRVRQATTSAALRLTAAEEEWQALVRDAAMLGRGDLQLIGISTVANMLGRAGRLDEADALMAEGLTIARALGNREAEIQLTMLSGNLRLNRRGDPAGLDLLLAALDVAEDLDDKDLIALCLAQIGTSYLNLGRPTDAEEPLLRCAEVGRETATVRWGIIAESTLVFVRSLLGPWEEAEESGRRALELLKRNPSFTPEFQTLRQLGRLAILRGDLDEADGFLRASLEVVRKVGGWWVVGAERHAAEVPALRGDAATAAAAAAAARAVELPANPSVDGTREICDALASLAAGDHNAMRASFERGIAQLAGPSLAFDRAEETLTYARVLRHIGDEVAAGDWFGRAREEYERMDARALVTWIDDVR